MNKLFSVSMMGLMVFALSGATAGAGDWSAIRANSSLRAEFPTIQIAGSFVTVDELCFSGNDLFLKERMRERCVQFDSGESGACLETALVEYRTSRVHAVEHCLNWTQVGDATVCDKMERYPALYPLKYSVTVSAVEQAGDGFLYSPLFVKDYEIPACAW